MIHNILVLTDFSNDAYNALYYATQLYENQGCKFHILHSYDRQSNFKEDYNSETTTKSLVEFIGNRTEACLRETYHKITADTEKNPLHQFVTVLMNNSLEMAVKSYIIRNSIDLIVMGTKGRTGALDILFGGNTIHMVKSKIYCPLLCIPNQIDYRPISQMGYITSFRHNLDKSSLKIVKSLASNHEAALHIVRIDDGDLMNESQEKNKADLGTYFEDNSVRFHTVACNASKSKAVVQFAKAHEIDLLVMYYYPHFFLDKLFREPVLINLSFYTEIPLLILPYQEQEESIGKKSTSSTFRL